MISYVLGFRTSEYVHETILAMTSIFIPGEPPAIKFDFATFISNKIHEKFMSLNREGVFKYTTYIYHLFLYYQIDSFQFPIKKLDAKGERRSVIFWTPVFHIIHKYPYTYCEFIDLFICLVSSLLMRSPPPRLSAEMQKILQLSKSYKIGDWYFYQNHIEIRIYGCELCPYKLPNYVPMRLFALEYFRQFISLDLTHFYEAKKKAQLKLRNQLGPLIINKKEGWKDAKKILSEQLKLKRSFWWVPYDPKGFIHDRKTKYRLSGYEHCRIPDIQQYANQDEWVEGTLVEQITEEEKMEQAMKDLEKTLDLDSFGHVSFKLPQHIGAGTLAATTSQQPVQEDTPSVGTSKGK